MNTQNQLTTTDGSAGSLALGPRSGRRTVKVSDASKRDFDFFLATTLDMIGETDVDAVKIEQMKTPTGYTALECWHLKDTHGKMEPCREAHELKKAVRGKKSWNLQIKMWAEDLGGDLPTLCQRELREWCEGLPPWIFEATVRQAAKLARERMQWSPRFTRLEKLFGFWWPPDMDPFDACI
jgi:hypothetical protein